MKRFIKWRCHPAPYGYHLVATTDIGGKAQDVNIAIEQMVWDRCRDRKHLLADVTFQVGLAFNHIAAEMAQRPATATLH